MQQIRILSDIHLEFFENDDFKLGISKNESDTILLLAGDIAVATKMARFRYFFEDVSERFHTVLYIAGNHEFYGGSIGMTPVKIKDCLKKLKNVHFLENQTYTIGDIIFICCTLWTDYLNKDPIAMFDAKHKMSDYKRIRIGPKTEPWRCKFAPDDALLIFEKSKKFIFDTLKHKQKGKKYVIMTHMAPSSLSVPNEFKGDKLNGAYHSNLENEILDTEPDLMIHGHTHNSFDYNIGKTRVVCNPYGYNGHQVNKEFIKNFIIEV